MRAHRMHFRGRELGLGVFKPQGGGMSVNWSKYASKEETRQQAKSRPEDNAVISLPVGGIREIRGLTVEHTPEPENRAHSEVFGMPNDREQLAETRVLLGRIAEVVLPL
jgi:hypothetical protein